MRLLTLGSSLAAVSAIDADPASYPTGMSRNKPDEQTKHKEAVGHYQMTLSKWKKDAEKKKALMTPHEAVKNLVNKKIMSESEKAKMTALLTEAEDDSAPEESKESKFSKLTRAVQVLNEMFLNLDKERVTTETSCIVDLEHMYKTDEQYKYEWWKAYDGNQKLKKENVALTKDVAEAEEDYDSLEYKFKQAAAANKAEYKKQHTEDFIPADADVKLFEFIATQIDEHCKDGKGMGLMQEKQLDESQCEGREQKGVSEALISIFSDPLVMEKVEQLPVDQRKRFEEEVEALGAAELGNDGDDGTSDDGESSFVQLKSKDDGDVDASASSFYMDAANPKGRKTMTKPDGESPPVKDVSKSKWAKNKNAGGCGKVNCDDLRSIIGIELVCKRKLRDAEAAQLEELEEKHQDDAAANRQALLVAREKIDNQESAKKSNVGLMGIGDQQMKEVAANLDSHVWKSIEREHECHDRLEEIYGNNYCSASALREFMLKQAKKVYKTRTIKGVPKKVQDCVWDDKFTPDPDCKLNGKTVPCVEGDVMSHNKDNLPNRLWTRTVTVQNNTHPLAMPCPTVEALELKITCNNFLCPIDCLQSDWNPPPEQAECSNKCTKQFSGDASKTFTRTVKTAEKYMGDPCGEPMKEQVCIDNTECPIDCMQRKRVAQCAESCFTGTRKERDRSKFGRGRLWNRVVTKYIRVHPRNGGKSCDPEGKGLMSKRYDFRCRRSNKACKGNEMCLVDQRDIVIAYECSAGMQDGYGESSCRRAVTLVRDLMEKMYSDYFGIPGVRVALIKFGNGKTEKTVGGDQVISDVQLVSPWTGNLKKLDVMLDHDDAVDDKNWHWGFANFNQMLKKAQELLGSADDPALDGAKREKALLILTKGKRIECSDSAKIAADIRKEGHKIHVALFSHDYLNNPGKFALAKDMASFPADIYFNHFKGYSDLFTENLVKNMVPQICNKARDARYLKRFNNPRSWFRPVHMARVCRTWRTNLFSKFRIRRAHRTLGWCIRLAFIKGFRGAMWRARWLRRGKKRINLSRCMVDMKLSKLPQVLADGKPNDHTCGCIALDGQKCAKKNARSQVKGWSQQSIDVARARPWRDIHFRTLRDGKKAFKTMAGREGKYDANFHPKKKKKESL